MNEVQAIIEAISEDYKDNWEQTRYIAFITAAVNSSKIKQPQDLFKFSWEKDVELEKEEEISPEERQARAQDLIDWRNKNK